MGKTWLLQELGRRLSSPGENSYLVGYFESRGGGEDSLLRALVDLYIIFIDTVYRNGNSDSFN